MKLEGAVTALVTPFRNGAVDEEKYREFIEWQINQGIHGLLPCGTTGESATLSHKEHESVIKICIDQVRGRVPVLAGAGSNNTAEAISLTRFAKEAGADAALHITPYYNKPTQEGIFRHFQAISAAVDMPLFVYNVPGRTGGNVLPATLARMARELPSVIGVKEASGNMVQVSNVLELCGPDFQMLSGEDSLYMPSLALGGKGVISVTSNIAPSLVAGLYNAWKKGDREEALRLHFQLEPLNRAMFMETNPIPVKSALARMGKMTKEFRLPLCELMPQNEPLLEAALREAGLI